MSIRAVHHLNCLTMCPRAGGLLGIPRLVSHCLLIETARDGLILVDTGLSTIDIADRTRVPAAFRVATGPRLDPAEPAAAQVVARGFAPSDVKHLVLTHLDVDHAGGMVDFPHATVHVHAREHAAAMTRATRNEHGRYVPVQWAHGPRWALHDTDGETWRGLPAVRALPGVDADIGMVALHGHTRGHSGVVVGGTGGTAILHAGDALFSTSSLTGPTMPWALRTFERVMAVDNAARVASLDALRTLHATGNVHIISAHDPSQLPHA